MLYVFPQLTLGKAILQLFGIHIELGEETTRQGLICGLRVIEHVPAVAIL